MKIFSSEQIRSLDLATIKKLDISSLELMERAATALFNWFQENISSDKIVRILVGPGNNGGDGFALARLLYQSGYKVEIDIVNPELKFSPDAEANFKKLPKNILQRQIQEVKDIPLNHPSEIIVDALFGSGLNRPLEGIYKDLVEIINNWDSSIISIDIPSGMFCDSPAKNQSIVKADVVLSFQFPKLAFLFGENGPYIEDWEILDIGISAEEIEKTESSNFFTDFDSVRPYYRKRDKHSHKGNFGHGCVMAGSKGKMGAAILCSYSALRTGLGLLTSYTPEHANVIMQSSIPEAMNISDPHKDFISNIPDLDKFNAVAIGPGIGTGADPSYALSRLLNEFEKAIVIDADAINILAKDEALQKLLNEKHVLTPHPGEFRRLVGDWTDSSHKYQLQREFSQKHKCIVLLKGAHSSISDANGNLYFNSTGNPGMASAGSGDCLTGIICALLAKNYVPLEAAIFGAYIHGRAADHASRLIHEESLISGDIPEFISNVFNELEANAN